MSIVLSGLTFDGPYRSPDGLEDRSGAYAVLCSDQNRNRLLDVGESHAVKSRLEMHDREDCWRSNCDATIMCAVHYTPGTQQTGRVAIEQLIRQQCDPPCGER